MTASVRSVPSGSREAGLRATGRSRRPLAVRATGAGGAPPAAAVCAHVSAVAQPPRAQPLPLIVFGERLSPASIAAQLKYHLKLHQHQALATGIEPATYARVRELLPGVKYHAGAKLLTLRSDDGALARLPGTVGVASAGPAGPAGGAERARLLLQHLGAFAIVKAGLSDPAAVAAAAPALAVCDVVIVLPGDGEVEGDAAAPAALPLAVASLVDAPVLAVPAAAAGDAGAAAAAELSVALSAAGAPAVAVTAADGGVAAAAMAARMLRVAAARAVQIAEAAAVARGAAAASAAGVVAR